MYLGQTFPLSFETTIRKVNRQLIDVIAHLYRGHHSDVRRLGLEAHLNTLHLHFQLFNRHFRLIDVAAAATVAAANWTSGVTSSTTTATVPDDLLIEDVFRRQLSASARRWRAAEVDDDVEFQSPTTTTTSTSTMVEAETEADTEVEGSSDDWTSCVADLNGIGVTELELEVAEQAEQELDAATVVDIAEALPTTTTAAEKVTRRSGGGWARRSRSSLSIDGRPIASAGSAYDKHPSTLGCGDRLSMPPLTTY